MAVDGTVMEELRMALGNVLGGSCVDKEKMLSSKGLTGLRSRRCSEEVILDEGERETAEVRPLTVTWPDSES